MSTQYVFEQINIGDGLTLYIDGNSKITVENGTYEDPVPNAFSLPHISTCPGATQECMSSCYVYGLQKNAPEVYANYCHNERVINKILSETYYYLVYENEINNFANWISKNCKYGFRWHVSGDIMSVKYAYFIKDICDQSKDVRHWIYTRSFFALSILSEVPNLTLNISADSENYETAKECASHYNLRLCYLTRDGVIPNDLPNGSVIFPDYKLRGRELDNPTDHSWWQGLEQKYKKMVCPADFFGQSKSHRCGPCNKCLKRI